MKFVRFAQLSILPVFCRAQGFGDLLSAAFTGGGEAPEFVAVPQSPNVAVAQNETALLKVSSLMIDPYPLRPGVVNFTMMHSLAGSIDPGATLHVSAWSKDKQIYNGTIDLCQYLPFAKLPCPVESYFETTEMLQRLQVPKQVSSGRVSFVAKAVNPDGALIVHVAALVDVETPTDHDEL